MENVKDYMIEPEETKREVYGRCEKCGEIIYIGDVIYSSCDMEVCEECSYEFLNEYRRYAEWV